MNYTLSDTQLLAVTQTDDQKTTATFVIEPFLPGFGVSIGNTLRRILLSSIEGAAVTSVRINGATHEFTTLKGVREDLVTVVLNLKQIKVKLSGHEPTSVVLKKSGPGTVTVADFKPNAMVEFTDPKQVIATLEKDGKLELEIEIAKGRGYLATEARKEEKLPLGTIAIDAVFSPVTRVSYSIDNTRVGNLTNYDRITMTISTDGSVTPRQALEIAAKIAVEHFAIIAGTAPQTPPAESHRPDQTDSTGELESADDEGKVAGSKLTRSKRQTEKNA